MAWTQPSLLIHVCLCSRILIIFIYLHFSFESTLDKHTNALIFSIKTGSSSAHFIYDASYSLR